MELVVRRGGEEVRVEVERRGEDYEVRLGERRLTVQRVAADELTRSLTIGGRQHEVSVRRLGENRYRVAGAGGEEILEVLDPLTHLARRGGGGAAARGAHRVAAYMPGRVVAVLVAEGAEVTRGQGLIILEAMKMQNEIEAESDGTVRKVHVEAGQAVETGDPLFEIG